VQFPETMDLEEEIEKDRIRYKNKFGTWVECKKCRSLMYDSFQKCWSCGSAMRGRNIVPVSL
jgi:acetyl-CoA carboxylase beta subunit